MRLRKRAQQKLQLKKKTIRKDDEGNVFPSDSIPIDFFGEVWPATSKLQIELYGNRISTIMNLICCDTNNIAIDDRIIFDGIEYNVISKKEYTHHCVFEIERI